MIYNSRITSVTHDFVKEKLRWQKIYESIWNVFSFLLNSVMLSDFEAIFQCMIRSRHDIDSASLFQLFSLLKMMFSCCFSVGFRAVFCLVFILKLWPKQLLWKRNNFMWLVSLFLKVSSSCGEVRCSQIWLFAKRPKR